MMIYVIEIESDFGARATKEYCATSILGAAQAATHDLSKHPAFAVIAIRLKNSVCARDGNDPVWTYGRVPGV